MSKVRLLISSAFWISAAAGALTANSAMAQEADDGSQPEASEAGGDIIVTARRRAEDVSKVPLAISAFSGETLEQKGIFNPLDLVRITPGLNITPGGSRANPFIAIRGFSKGLTGNVSPGVISYLNDVPLSNYGSLLPTFDVQNIQVLKGPQGTLFGRNAIGGAILAYSNAPAHDFGGYAKIDAGSYDFVQFEGAVNVPIIADAVALRIAGQVYHDGGSITTNLVTPISFNGGIASPGTIIPSKHRVDAALGRSFRASLLIEPTDSIKNVTVFDHSTVRGGTPNYLLDTYPNGYNGARPANYWVSNNQSQINLVRCGNQLRCDYRLVQDFYNNSDRTIITNSDPWLARAIVWGITNTTTFNFNDNATLKNIFAYRSVNTFNNTDSDGSPLLINQSASQVNLEQFTNELQLAGDLFDSRLKYTVGGFYYNERPGGRGGNQSTDTNVLVTTSHNIAYTYLHNTSKAIYGQFDFSLFDGLTLTAGARQTWDDVEGCAGSIALSPTSPELLVTGPNSSLIPSEDQCVNNSVDPTRYPGVRSVLSQNLPKKTFKKLTYTLGANWQITPDAMIYGTHRRGYRAGSYNTPLFDPQFLGQIQTFAPETLEDWEVGTKIRWRSGGMSGSLDASAFTGKNKGNQLSVITSGLAAGICVPEAVSSSRPANCTGIGGAPGVTITHPASRTILNAGELTIRGFEIAGTISPVQGLTIGGGVAHLDYKVDKITLDPNLAALLTAANAAKPTTIALDQQPRWTYNAEVTYAFPDKILDSNLTVSANWKHSGKYPAGEITGPAYDVVDARITFADIAGTGLDISAYVRNLFNEYYFAGVPSAAPTGNGYLSAILGPPRTVALSVKYKFGN